MILNRCPWCGARPFSVIHVHGHGQCSSCGINVEPCCSGEGLENIPCDSPEKDPTENKGQENSSKPD